ncbi:MAG: hypothetical protein MJZ11_02260 [Lachnospiraceae bacterium]|nr:hypothetical protein [Lachnospiraceae bacterium]
MAQNQLKQEEIEYLLSLLKSSLVETIGFPEKGESETFQVKSNISSDLFDINIYRGNVNRNKYNISAVIEKNSIPILELHINPGNRHTNPDGSIIEGNHWHIYSEEYERRQAFPADELSSERFIENTIAFLDKFNVIEKPDISYQLEIV